MGLFSLLLVTVVFAAGAIYVKFKLDSVRLGVADQLAARVGAKLSFDRVSLNGLRGFRVDQLKVEVVSEGGPTVNLSAPAAYLNVHLNDLLSGKVTIDRVVLDNARIVIERPPEADWHRFRVVNLAEDFSLRTAAAFRITGKEGRLEVRNVVGDTRLEIDRLAFDVSRLSDAPDVTARIEGDLGGDANKRVTMRLSMASLEDFDLQVQSERITADDFNVFLPAERRFVESGTASPTFWVNGRPDRTIMVTLQSAFDDLFIRNQPEFLPKAGGSLVSHAVYSLDTHELTITAAKADSRELGGALEGSISFAGDYPAFDLRLKATRLPIAQFLSYALDGEMDDFTHAELVLNEPYELVLALEGTSDAPRLKGTMRAGSGEFSFQPKDPDQPAVALQMGLMEGGWDTESEGLSGKFAVLGGRLRHGPTGLDVENISGTVAVENGVLSMAPLNAVVTGNPLVGRIDYDLNSGNGDVTLTGTLSHIEDTELASLFPRTAISGAAIVRQGRVSKRGDLYAIQAEIDATQARVDYDWWLSKPAGVGAMTKVDVRLTPRKSMTVNVEADVASSQLTGTAELAYDPGRERRWRLNTVEAESPRLDVNMVGKCLVIPYRITGGTGTSAYFRWERDDAHAVGWRIAMGGSIDEIAAVPDGAAADKVVRASDVTVEATETTGEGRTGTVTLRAQSAFVPRLGTVTFHSLAPPPGTPHEPRDWTFSLSADHLELPPWKGMNFRGEAYTNQAMWGFASYGADIEGEGRLDGSYHLAKATNESRSEIKWRDVPAAFFLDHLNYPPVLTGRMTGEVVYSLDRDDPGTLRGEGHFHIRDGQFSADFMLTLLEGRMENELAALPPSLKFSQLRSAVTFDRDIVRTPELMLDSEGITMQGSGHYVHDGDLEYTVVLAVAPDMAEKIPILADSFNIQGHRLTQQNIVLGFKIDGPTFSPQGQLEKLPPASVALMSGAFEVGSEALRVIDTPRRILVDLLKIAGGLMGAGR